MHFRYQNKVEFVLFYDDDIKCDYINDWFVFSIYKLLQIIGTVGRYKI